MWRAVSAVVLALSFAPLLAPAPAAETPAPRWIAADAAVYLEVSRPALLIDTALRPQVQGALRALPPLQKFLEGESYRTLRMVADVVAERLGTTSENALRKLTAGGVTLAIEGEAGSVPRTFLVVTPDDADFGPRVVDAVITLARQDAANKGKPDPVKSAEYRDARGYEVGKVVYALVEGSLVFSDRAETLKTIIDRARDGMKGAGAIADDDAWKARRARVASDALGWGFARLDRLRTLDPKRFNLPGKPRAQLTLLFGSWLEALRTAPWIEASLSGGDRRLAASVTLPVPPGGYRESLAGFVPAHGTGAPGLLSPPGTIANLSLWRDASAIWEARTELFTPEVQQNLAKLDTFAGQFFGGRDFGTGVLGALDPRWRLVIAHQDYRALAPSPDLRLPGFALIADLNPDDDDFNQRLKVAFQSFVGLVNLGAAQKGEPPLEQGSEVFEGVTISTSRYMVPKAESADAKDSVRTAVHQRFNFTPSIAQVENHFILSTSVGLTRALIQLLKAPAAVTDVTLLLEADGPALAHLVALNRNRLIMQNMLDKGHDQAAAETEIDQLGRLLHSLGRGRLTVQDGSETLRFDLGFTLSNSPEPNRP
jgi:hypothetical protein